jgi:hypothetical protein
MTPWIFVHNPLEHWLGDYRRTFDAWEDGGVRGIVVGRLWFQQEPGNGIPLWGEVLTPAFAADPKIYAKFGINPPPSTPRNLEKEKQLHQMLDDAASRGWHIMIFDSRDGLRLLYQRGESIVSGLGEQEDPHGAIEVAAGIQDILEAFPQAHGVILDQPGEQDYELAYHRGTQWLELDDYKKWKLSVAGVDVERAAAGMAYLNHRFRNLTPELVRYHASGGMLAALELFDVNDDVLYWLRARRQAALGFMAAVREQVDRLERRLELGGIPRTAAFSGLTGNDLHEMASYFDYVLPKHYFWHRGNDGMYGTVARWAKQIGAWNADLNETDCFAVVKALMGLELPRINSLADMDLGFPDEFFSHVVHNESKRALAAVGDDQRVIAWVSTGRNPHGGEPMTARDLQGILAASQEAGLQRFLFQPDPDLSASEWTVISGMCGNRWRQDPQGYWPSDSTPPEAFGRDQET